MIKFIKIMLIPIIFLVMLVNINAILDVDCSTGECNRLCPENCIDDGAASSPVPRSGGRIYIKMDLGTPNELKSFSLTGGSDCHITSIEDDFPGDDEAEARGIDGIIIDKNGRLSDGVASYSKSDDDAVTVLRSYRPGMDILCDSSRTWRMCDSSFANNVFYDGSKYYRCTSSNDWEETSESNCGNGNIDSGEDCDGTNLNSKTCSNYPQSTHTGGTLRCSSSSSLTPCKFDTSECTGGGVGQPPCSYPGPHTPDFSVPENPNSIREKVGRIMMCYPPVPASMDNLVSYSNSVYSTGISRVVNSNTGGFRDDSINIPGGRIIDVIADCCVNGRWTWQDVTGSTSGGGIVPACSCGSWNSGVCAGGSCSATQKYQTRTCSGTGCSTSQCVEDSTCSAPLITSINPASLRNGQELTIDGVRLTETIQFSSTLGSRAYTGTVNPAKTQTAITIAPDIPVGTYSLNILAGLIPSNTVSVTISSGILKYTPDGVSSGYCSDDSQCLLDAGTGECINNTQYSEDDYCDGGIWSTRTKLLATKLLTVKEGDYKLFCSSKEETLNDLNYIVSGKPAIDIISELDANNFCVLSTSNKLIIGTALDNNLSSVPSASSLFKISGCNLGNSDQYTSCDSSNKAWYNSRHRLLIFSDSSISVPAEQNLMSFFNSLIRNPIQALAQKISNIIAPPFDPINVQGINKFEKLFFMKRGSKEIRSTLDGTNLKNIVLEYSGFSNELCSYVQQFNSNSQDGSSGIECKREGNIHYVHAQGNGFSNVDPDKIWADLTSNLRVE